MSGFVFVCDAQGKPLMPMSPAYARRLLASGKAVRKSHHAFSIIQLTRVINQVHLRPVVLGVALHLNMAELFLLVDEHRGVSPLLSFVVDLRIDLPWRMRRRRTHHRRRRYQGHYRKAQPFAWPFARRRPSLHCSRWVRRRLRTLLRSSGPKLAQPQRIRWCAGGILCVIQALRQIVPVSHVVIVAPQQSPATADWPHGSEAGMSLLLPVSTAQRAGPYVRQMAALLWKQLGGLQVVRLWIGPGDDQSRPLAPLVIEKLMAFARESTAQARVVVVKLMSWPRGQRCRVRSSPLAIPMKSGMVRVNRGLAIIQDGQQRRLQVVEADASLPANTLQLITIGMLCEVKQADVLLRGIVVTVHSNMWLTLLVPREVSSFGVRWERVLVRPSVHLRVISTEQILFFATVGRNK